MILTGPAIRAALASGAIECTPFDPAQVAQASIDVHLHPKLLGYYGLHKYRSRWDRQDWTLGQDTECPWGPLDVSEWHHGELDLATEHPTDEVTIPASGLVLLPGVLYLGATIERLHAPGHVMVLDGKSSPARKGLQVHATAGYVEPGFHGQLTLEITVAVPLRVYEGWPVAQVRFHTIQGEVESYEKRGTYQGALSDGPVPSQSHKHKPRHVGAKP